MSRLLTFLLILLLIPTVELFATDPLVGRWQINGGGALIEISARPGNDGSLKMVWIDGPDLTIPSGTEIAIINPTHTIGTYDCRAWTDPTNSGKSKKNDINFVIKFDSGTNNSIGFKAYQRKKTISLWRWLPYLFRVTVKGGNNRPDNLDGAIRVTDIPRQITI